MEGQGFDSAAAAASAAEAVQSSPPPPLPPPPGSIFPPLSEFVYDAEHSLGRGNGNTHIVREGIEDKNDGRIMIRLSNRRFIFIDYGVVPTEADLAYASTNPHVACPEGAGTKQCTDSSCSKVGVPVLLYDSHPNETPSLYLRSGLCFSCQKKLNEMRRGREKKKKKKNDSRENTKKESTKKRKGGDATCTTAASKSEELIVGSNDEQQAAYAYAYAGSNNSLQDVTTYAEENKKRFRMNGDTIDLMPDAIVINGPLEGAKRYGPDYGSEEISNDLRNAVREASYNVESLLTASNTNFQQFSSNNGSVAAAASGNGPDAAAAVVNTQQANEEILAQYERTFLSMSRGIYLLSQWKAAMMDETADVAGARALDDIVADVVNETVASAFAGGGISNGNGQQDPASLLMASEGPGAENDGGGGEDHGAEVS